MMTTWMKRIIPTLLAAFLLSACQQQTQDPNTRANSAGTGQNGTQNAAGSSTAHSLHDAGVIPYYAGPKTQSTNEHGGTTHGLGTSVYSLIGSSGLHSDGISSHLESRLSGEGIQGVKVFALDNMVILAAESRQATASQYDPVQQKVLSPYGGQSAHGPEPGVGIATPGSGKMVSDDNLAKAESRIQQIMGGGQVKVLTVTGQQAMDTIDRIRSASASGQASSQELADQIRKLLDLTAAKK